MSWWTRLTRKGQWLVGAIAALTTIIGTLVVFHNQVKQGVAVVDSMVTTEAEHDHDVDSVLQEIYKQNRRIELQSIGEDIREKTDMLNRNAREIKRLERDLAGGHYSNEGELAVMSSNLASFATENLSLAGEIAELKNDKERLVNEADAVITPRENH